MDTNNESSPINSLEENKTQQTDQTVENSEFVPELKNEERSSSNSPGQTLVEKFSEIGVEAKVMPLLNSSSFTEIVLLPKKEIPKEKTVRIFRGVNQLDASLLNQIPYGMRVDTQNGFGTAILENIKDEVNLLAQTPTYEHLADYVVKARPQFDDNQRSRFDRDLEKIENGILEGYSMRTELIYDQIGHNGGSMDSGISPYLSASYSPFQALEYSRPDGALIVIDVPISQIEDFNSDGSETNIKGTLGPESISAIILRNGDFKKTSRPSQEDIDKVLGIINENITLNPYTEDEVEEVRSNQIKANKLCDIFQHKVDLEEVQKKRANDVLSKFKNVTILPEDLAREKNENNIDEYSAAKNCIFDHFVNRLKKIGKNGIKVSEYEYKSETRYGERKSFDRSVITDNILMQLQELVEWQEQREKTRREQNHL